MTTEQLGNGMGAHEELNFNFYFLFINLKENSHMWLTVILLDSRGICVRQNQFSTEVCRSQLCVQSQLCLAVFVFGASQVVLVVKNLAASTGDINTQVQSLGREDPLEEGMATHSSILAWEPIDRGAWQSTVHSFAELNMTEAT